LGIDGNVRTLTAATLLAVVVLGCTQTGSTQQAQPQDPLAPTRTPAPKAERPHFEPPSLKTSTDHPDDWFQSACSLPAEQFRRIARGHRPGNSPELYFVPRTPNFFGHFHITTHSGPWPYLQRVPLVLYGPGFFSRKGAISRPGTTLADVAPTLAEITNTEFSGKGVGSPISEALSPTQRVPRLIVVVVWDGGGRNVLETWPDSWPNLKGMMRRGTSITDATVGSSPSVTPAVHATIGTGTFPRRHGIVDMHVRDGTEVPSAFENGDPKFLRVPTFADFYDRDHGNRPKVGMFAYHRFHAGMMGHGAQLPGGDRDIQVIAPSAPSIRYVAEESYYRLPEYLDEVGGFAKIQREVDSRDGKIDGRWRGRDLDDRHDVRHSPVWVQFQTKILKAVVEREGFGADRIADLLFVNYKQIDDAGHDWNMLSPEMKDVVAQADEDLGDLTRFLNRQVGKREWALMMTADHGQAPDPRAAGAWPIGISILLEKMTRHFETEEETIIDETRPTGLWLDQRGLKSEGISTGDIADFILDYRIEDDTNDEKPIPPQYEARRREPLFSAVFPSSQIGRVSTCIQRQRGG
jgi:hypothetical protein